jgi:hypothetical protein
VVVVAEEVRVESGWQRWCSGRAVLAAGKATYEREMLRRFVERAKAPSGGAMSSPPVLLHLHYIY